MKNKVSKLFAITVLFSVLTMTCEDSGISESLINDNLEQSWTHSFEEQDNVNSTIRLFRKSDSRQFAVSRFRDAYEFSHDGTCRYMFLHPADAHYMADGRYVYDQTDSTLTIYNDEDELIKVFRIIELTADKLLMEQID